MRLAITSLIVGSLAMSVAACSVASPDPAAEPITEARPVTPEPTTDKRPATPTPTQNTGTYNLASDTQCEAAATNYWRLTTKQAMDGLGPDATIEQQAQVHGVLEEQGPQFIVQWKKSCLGTMPAPMVACFATMRSFDESGACARAQ